MTENAKPVLASQTTITELMIPSYANFGGKIHGGILLSLMDKVAYACASKHAGAYCVTVSVDRVEFMKPVEVGELVSLHASVNYVVHHQHRCSSCSEPCCGKHGPDHRIFVVFTTNNNPHIVPLSSH